MRRVTVVDLSSEKSTTVGNIDLRHCFGFAVWCLLKRTKSPQASPASAAVDGSGTAAATTARGPCS